ncbi:MAG: hypothetical protein FP824_09100 [Euryarchaeota archaeon]|nr:hypothetical protein [Euryarchaeota archaeon]
MKKLGTVKNVIHDGTILLSISETTAQDIPAQGARVYDQRGGEVGRVARVFGPVNAPYVSLRPRSNVDTLGLLGTSLYLDPEEKLAPKRTQTSGRSFINHARSKIGSSRKKGVKQYRRKEKPRKK